MPIHQKLLTYLISMPVIISLEGNIGAGKTTILTHLENQMRDDPTVAFLREPVDLWQTFRDATTGENILQKFYQDTDKYAFSFQIMACVTRLSQLKQLIRERPECTMIICERSLDADKHIFATMLSNHGNIESINMRIYDYFYNEFASEFLVNGIVYIDADPAVCHHRIQNRGRMGEDPISLEYLTECNQYYLDWLVNTSTPMISIPVNETATYDMSDTTDIGLQWIDQIRHFANGLRTEVTVFQSEAVMQT